MTPVPVFDIIYNKPLLGKDAAKWQSINSLLFSFVE